MKLERAIQNSSDKSASFNPRSYRTALPLDDELSSAVSRIGMPPGEDPFGAEMAEATRRGSLTHDQAPVNAEGAESNLPHDHTDADRQDDVEEDESPEHRVAKVMHSGDVREEVYVSRRLRSCDHSTI